MFSALRKLGGWVRLIRVSMLRCQLPRTQTGWETVPNADGWEKSTGPLVVRRSSSWAGGRKVLSLGAD